ncbi:calcium/sodium antiporter [Anaeromyxobacter oryzae]|uniref:Sodium:calcium antiporter n=1 Tax=Anaeromyxobacter oryzae TaxID=2918170 RepID=A0ABM7WZC9_9BACT|nr:calcium/sodium antiporter [Anaeromyxobacter oryzae]BDG04842.1 sodium:calcium antiporter [Anaeromyxobacter oryzae]
MTLATLALLVLGLALLTAGAEALVRGASRLALAAGLSPLVIGLTVVAYGTSTPELVVSTMASLRAQPDIAVANVVGSNVFNVLFILGACAVILPLAISRQVWRREVPIMIGASLLLLAFAADGRVGRGESLVLLAGIVGYTVVSIRASRRESAAAQAEAAHGERLDRPARRGLGTSVLLVLGGLGALVLGARWLVDSAVAIARAAGLSEVVIGLTIVAAGTSLPEVATSIVATIRGERDIAVGNVVGSNVYNVLAILGVAGLVAPGGLVVHRSLVALDIPFMTAVAVACLPLFFTARTLARWEGGLFLGYYAAYTAYLVLAATEHDALPAFSRVMWLFVAPITIVTIAVVTVRAIRIERRTTSAARG